MKRESDGRVKFESLAELPPVTISFASTAWNRTGLWRSREPAFAERRAPCAAICPAGEDVPDQLRFAAEGDLAAAGELLLRANPFPAVTGRVCPHPCTDSCNRREMDGAVDVPGVEREIGDDLLRRRFRAQRAPSNGRRIAVVGAGPAGLTAAYHLALAGFGVDLFDREERPGGLLWTGIPPYRLPREVLEGEISRVLDAGVAFHGEHAFTGNGLEELREGYDATLLAVGLGASHSLRVPGEKGPGVVHGLDLLRGLHRGEAAPAGDPVLVVGGGNTAFDCARSLNRAGRRVTVVYRRDRSAMPAFAEEIEEAIEEGVRVEEWRAPVEVRTEGGRVVALRCVRTRAGAPDASGRPRPEPVPGSEEDLPAGLVVVAAGEVIDRRSVPEGLLGASGVAAQAGGRTDLPWLFACGDCTGDGGTVAIAIGRGRGAAAAICSRFEVPGPELDLPGERGAAAEVAGPERVRARCFESRPPLGRPRLPADARGAAEEVRPGFGPERARREAERCLSCGTCTDCGTCWILCPEQAIRRGGPGRYEVDVTRCKGCGICAEECPRGAVDLREAQHG